MNKEQEFEQHIVLFENGTEVTTNSFWVYIYGSIKLAAKIALVLLLIYTFFVGLLSPASAQTPTTSIGDQIKDKVQNIAGNQRLAGFMGEVTDKTDGTMTITTKNSPRQTTIDPKAVVISQKNKQRKTVTSDDIAINDFIIAMGTLDSGNKTFIAKRILIIDKPLLVTRTALNGTITQIDTNQITLETKSRGEWLIKLTSKTAIRNFGNAKALKTTDLELHQRVLFMGKITGDKTLEASSVLILPVTGSPTRSASPSAAQTSVTPTKSVTPTRTPTPKP